MHAYTPWCSFAHSAQERGRARNGLLVSVSLKVEFAGGVIPRGVRRGVGTRAGAPLCEVCHTPDSPARQAVVVGSSGRCRDNAAPCCLPLATPACRL